MDTYVYKQYFTMSTASDQVQHLLDILKTRGYTISTPLASISSVYTVIQFQCIPCDTNKLCPLIDAVTIHCKACGPLLKKMVPKDITHLNQALKSIKDLYPDEEWAAVTGGWVSSYGNVVSCFGKLLSADERGRYSIGGCHEYLHKLMWSAFTDKITVSDHAKLQLSKDPCCDIDISIIDASKPVHVSNLLVRLKFECEDHKKRKKATVVNIVNDTVTTNVNSNPCQELVDQLVQRGCTLTSDVNKILSSKSIVNIVCSQCNQPRSGQLVDLVCKQCRNCGIIIKNLIPSSDVVLRGVLTTMRDIHEDEHWLAVEGGWISSYGKAVSCFGTVMKVDAAGRVKLGDKMQSVDKWVSQCFGTHEDQQVAKKAKVNRKNRVVLQYQVEQDNVQGCLIHKYESVTAASEATKIPKHVISDAAKGITKKTGLYIWKYEDESLQ